MDADSNRNIDIVKQPDDYRPNSRKMFLYPLQKSIYLVISKVISSASGWSPAPNVNSCMMMSLANFLGSLRMEDSAGTFVVISRLETRMSIRLMEALNGSKEQYNSQSAFALQLRGKQE